MESELLIELARTGSETTRTTFDFLAGLERLSSSNERRWSLSTPIRTFDTTSLTIELCHIPSEISFAFSKACAALLKGAKLTKLTIFWNLARSLMDSWTSLVKAAMFSLSLISKTAKPEADSKSAWVAMLVQVPHDDEG